MIRLFRTLPSGLAMAAGMLLVASCGGGGGDTAVTLGGVVQGLQPSSNENRYELRLSVGGVEQGVTTTTYGNLPVHFDARFVAGQSYNVVITRHPRGQLCRVTEAGQGVLQASSDAVVVACHTTVLNDTGLASDDPDGQQGRDAEARAGRLTKLGEGQAGFDFTAICRSGSVAAGGACTGTPVQGEADSWRCVRDNVTGLMWWREAAVGLAAPPDEACGVSAWRKPSVHELLSIVHAGAASGASIDADFFPGTPTSVDFVTAEPYLEPTTGVAGDGVWAVGFSGAGYAGKNIMPSALAVRWVAGTSRVNDAADGQADAFTCTSAGQDYTLVDSRRGLSWAVPVEPPAYTWEEARDSVAAVNAAGRRPGGYSDWRLPNRNELDSLASRSHTAPAVHPALARCQLSLFSKVVWSASTMGAGVAWAVSFEDGSISPMARSTPARAVYVRNRTDSAP